MYLYFFEYDYSETASYEDFKGFTESLKWYRKIIDDGNLSPVEKIMFATLFIDRYPSDIRRNTGHFM